MTFHVANGNGDTLDQPTPADMKAFLDAIDASDDEHGAAWLSLEDELSLEWNGDGRLVLSAPGQPPRHMKNVSREQALELWHALAAGNVARLEEQTWAPGMGYVRRAELETELRQGQLQRDREFYDLLGAERADTPCRREGCTRGAVSLSALCRVHHFESISHRTCPFDD